MRMRRVTCTDPNMRISLLKADPKKNLNKVRVDVEVSETDDPLNFIYSHSFEYKVPAGSDKKGKAYGEVIIYTDRDPDSLGNSYYTFDLEECRNRECRRKNRHGCPVIRGKKNRLLVTDIFHTQPKENALRDFGAALFKALFSGRAAYLTEPPHQNDAIYLQLNGHIDLNAIPWEYANNRAALIVHQRKFTRILTHVPKRPQDPLPNSPPRVVVVVPDPITSQNEPSADLPNLHLNEQFRNFVNGFTKNNKAVKLERVFPPSVSQMDTQLRNERETATVLHFIGHSLQKGVGNARNLIFEGNNGKQELIDASGFISIPDNLRLAFLSACNSRAVARALVERGVPYTIGSNCAIPNDLARKFEFEFYRHLTSGSTVQEAMFQARASLQNSNDVRRHNYFAGAMVLYSSNFGGDNMFQCEDGNPDIKLHEPPHNLTMLPTLSSFHGHKKELSKLYGNLNHMYIDLNHMINGGAGAPYIYTIKGDGGQEFVAEAMRRMAYLFPGGIFTWAFNKEKTSVMSYFRRLVEVIFPNGFWKQLVEKYGNDTQELGSAIIKELRNRATCLLIFNHADILDIGRQVENSHAEMLGKWLEDVASVQNTVKILLTSRESLDWLKGELMDLNDSSDLGINSDTQENTYIRGIKKRIHEYFPVYTFSAKYKPNRSYGSQVNKYFYGVPSKNYGFVDRSEIIQEMQAALNKISPSDECRILVLRGLGGMGKTQLMLRYCHRYKIGYNSIFWLPVDSWNVAVRSYYTLAGYLGLDEEILNAKNSEKKVIRWVIDWLEKNADRNWLLLLDGVDGDDMDKKVFELLPRVGGDIILTTRLNISSQKATVIQVDKMQEEEALLLLFGTSSMDSIDKESAQFRHARDITAELDCMPLAIDLARAYVKDTLISFENYLKLLREKRIPLFNYGDDSTNKCTVTTIWQLSFERIRDLNPIAVHLLKAFTFFHSEKIPMGIFLQGSVLDLVASKMDNEQLIGEAITLLAEFSFVTLIREYGDDQASNMLTIHRLVQKVIYDAMDDEQRLHLAPKIATALNGEIYLCKRYTLHTRTIMNTYLSHIRHFATLLNELGEQSLNSKDLNNVLAQVTQYYRDYGLYFDALFEQLSVRVSEAVCGPEHPSTATSRHNLANLYHWQGKYDEAELLFKQALAIREKVLGSEHLDIASSLDHLAGLYWSQGKYDESKSLFKRALAIREKADPDTVAFRDNQAENQEHTQSQLQLTKALLKPYRLLNGFVQDKIQLWKSRFPFDQELKHHLGELNILELSDFLVWVPFEELKELRQIAEGGFSKVWWAQIPRCGNRQVALKEMNQMLIQEIVMTTIISCQTLTSTVSSTASIRGLSIHPKSDKYLMVLDYLEGGDMEKRCKTTIPKSWDEIIEIADCLALNLADIHELGLTHNDLHPGNIMFYDSVHNRNYIIDIGLGKAIKEMQKKENKETSSDGCYGRLEYFPPEIFEQQPYTQSSDVYCFATLLWQLISRVPPRGTAKSPPEQAIQYTFHSREEPVLKQDTQRAITLREEPVPGMPIALQEIICDCWNPNPSERPTMRKVHSRLLEARSGLGDTFLGAETLAFITKRRANLEAEDGNSFEVATSQYYTSSQLASKAGSVTTSVSEVGSSMTSISKVESATTSVSKVKSATTSISKAESATSVSKVVSKMESVATSVSKAESSAASVSKVESPATNAATSISKEESVTNISKAESAATRLSKSKVESASVSKTGSDAASISKAASKAESAAASISKAASKAESAATSVSKVVSKAESTTSISKAESATSSASKEESAAASLSKVESVATNISQAVSKAESATNVSKAESAATSLSKSKAESASVSKVESATSSVSKAGSDAASISKAASKAESAATSVSKAVSKAESTTSISKAEFATSSASKEESVAASLSKVESVATNISQAVSKAESATNVSKAELSAASVSKVKSSATNVSKAVTKEEFATNISKDISKAESAATSVSKAESTTTSVSMVESAAASVSKVESSVTNVSKAATSITKEESATNVSEAAESSVSKVATSIFKAATSIFKAATSISKAESVANNVSKAESATSVSKVESAMTNVSKIVSKAESTTSASKAELSTTSVSKAESSETKVPWL